MSNMKRWQLLLVITLIIIIGKVSGEVSTSLEINYVNIAPQLIGTIPNQTWAMNTNLTESIDLDEYFLDTYSINYTASSVDSITVFINETTHTVSFYPSLGFQGIRTVVFTAFDGELYSNSNTVTLNVTPDSHPPKWSNPSVSSSEIKQNAIPTFSANWEDDTALKGFIMAINQAGAWINSSLVSFSGKNNVSSYSTQISAPGGTTVYWYIIGFDTSENMNATTMQNFTVTAAPSTPSQEGNKDSGKTRTGTTQDTTTDESTRDFTTDPATGFKIDMLENEEKTVSFKITNTGTLSDRFNISIMDLDKFEYIISNNNFTIAPGGSTVVTINFKAKKGTLPDLYYGSIRVRTSSSMQKLPLVIQLNALVAKLGLNVTIVDKKDYLPLQEVKANITLSNLQDLKPVEVYAYYALVDFSGTVIDSKSEQFVFDTKSVNFEKTLKLTAEVPLGSYIFLARAVTNGSVAIDSDSFEVGERTSFASLILGNIWIIVFVSSVLITLIIGITEYRNRRRLQLLNMYILANELSRLVKENNFNEAEKAFIKIKNYYHETISEELMNNKEKLREEIKAFSEKIDANLYATKVTPPKPEDTKQNNAPVAATTETEKAEPETKKEEKEIKNNTEKKEKTSPVKKTKTKSKKNGKKK
ncbi:MAG TPA: hypothetical protein VHA12_04055 [Candidatus Nanoarchaeia archaeon]|nr:hypothetical protein [Candidatus Nanoarchaeia archaeon]